MVDKFTETIKSKCKVGTVVIITTKMLRAADCSEEGGQFKYHGAIKRKMSWGPATVHSYTKLS